MTSPHLYAYTVWVSNVPRIFKLAFVEIVIVAVIIIILISSLFYLGVIPLPGNNASPNPLPFFSKGTVSTNSNVENYTLELKNKSYLEDTLNGWEFFGKNYVTSDGNTHKIDTVTVVLSADEPASVIKKSTLKDISTEIGEKVEENTLILTFYMQKKDLDTLNIPNTIITGNVVTYIVELINADKNTAEDRQKIIQLINETNRKLAENKSGFFIKKNK